MEQCFKNIDMLLPKDIDLSTDDLMSEIFKLRYLVDEFLYYPDYISKDLLSEASVPDLVYYPFDIIELRRLVQDGVKDIKPQKVYFSFEFAKKHFLDHSILIGFKMPYKQVGSMFIPQDDCDVELGRIYIRESCLNMPVHSTILNILRDENINIEVDNLLNIPIMRLQAVKKFNMKKYSMKDIKLTDTERKIFDFLLDAKNKNLALAGTQLRVAGGWIRDKLLGIPSDDIDIAVSGMTGQQFLNAIGFGGAHIIEKNPEKSKQLETAKADIFGQEVDFVNLRTEVYEPGSRIPTQTITDDPAEDAKRRDLTINAMFYNIETGQIEDYVGGLKDLETMALKTPMDPVKTLIDDPIRSLRILRFFSRYPNAQIDPQIIEAMKNPTVQKAYDSLAPERASKEIRKMFEGTKPVEAAKILLETGLYKKVFKLPGNWHPIDMDQQSPYHDFTLLNHTVGVMENYSKVADEMGVSKNEKGLMLLSALLHDFGKMNPDIRKGKTDKEGNPFMFDRRGVPTQQMRYMGHDKASAAFAEKIMKEMGFSPEEKKFVTTITQHHMTPHELVKQKGTKAMGRFLNMTDDLYEKVVGHALADALSKNLSDEEEQQIRDNYTTQIEQMKRYKAEMGERLKTPLLDGNKMREIVEQVAPELVTNKNAKITFKGYNKPVHFMTYLTDKMKEQQWAQKVNTPEEAENWLRRETRQFVGLWKQQQPQQAQKPIQKVQPSTNISPDINKQAQGNLNGGIDDYSAYEGQTPMQKSRGITYMERSVPTQYTVGTKVRLDVTGLGFPPIEGRVISQKNNTIIVEWVSGKYKGKRKAYDLTDTVGLSKLNVI